MELVNFQVVLVVNALPLPKVEAGGFAVPKSGSRVSSEQTREEESVTHFVPAHNCRVHSIGWSLTLWTYSEFYIWRSEPFNQQI